MVTNNLTLPGVGPNVPPGIYGQINYAQGNLSAGSGVYDVLILANLGAYNYVNGVQTATLASAGTLYGPDTQVTLQSQQDAINLFGDGYAAMLMFSDYININSSGNRVYVMPVTMATGSSATAVLTVATNAVTQTSGLINVIIGTDVVGVAFGSSDTVTTIASNIVKYVNGNTHLPVVASSLAGVVTFTTKSVASRANWLRWSAQLVQGAGITVNGSNYTGRLNFINGAGSDLTGYNTCVTNLIALQRRFFTIITEAGGDSVDGTTNNIASTVVTNLVDFQAQPLIGIRQRLFCGSVDTVANTTTVTQAINDPLFNVFQQYQNDVEPCRLAARICAGLNAFEAPFLQATGVNFDGFGSNSLTQPYWRIPAPLNGTAPSSTDIQNAVVQGISILKVLPGNNTCLVKACTSHFWTGTNAQFDPRIVDLGKVTICNYLLDDIEARLSTAIVGKLIGNDPPGGGVVAASVFTPNKCREVVLEIVNQYASAGLIDGPNTIAGLVVQRGTNPTSQLQVTLPTYTSDILHTIIIQENQVH
jgi:phage tail sheath gpL-like